MSSIPDELNTYERRFGNIAIKKGYITSDDLAEALKIHTYGTSVIDIQRLCIYAQFIAWTKLLLVNA